jgi:ATP-binding cassette subfamily B protein
VLQDLNFIAEPGKMVAILGATGSGKSTLLHLIPRLYDASSGKISIDGIDIKQVKQESLWKQIGIVLQETTLFSGTIADNIRYGKPEASFDEVLSAAKKAQAHEFIMEMTDEYNSRVEQRGSNLSGGQKQRIAIARAILIQPRILLLDDATSSVDVETEAKIQIALQELLKTCTAFVVAQRISTVLTADKILILDQGKIINQGSHQELMKSSPIYQDIFNSQLGNGGKIHELI